MQLITAEQKNSRQSPRKVRLAADAIRGMKLQQAIEQLSVIDTKGSEVILHVIRQAVANATNNLGLQAADLELDQIIVNQGQTYRRFRAVSRGRAHSIQKKTCHVRIVLKSEGTSIAVPKAKTVKKVSAKDEKSKNVAMEAPKQEKVMDQAKHMDKSAGIEKVQKPMAARLQPAQKKTVNRTTSK